MPVSANRHALRAPAHDHRGSALRERLGVAAARVHRQRLSGVSFIGVTGSVGKTTTKEMIAAALASVSRGRKSPADANNLAVIAKTILRTTKQDRFCVVEVAAGRQVGVVARSARLLMPDIAVVTTVGADHRSTYRTLDGTADEKRALLDNAAPGSTAVLNADDPRVLAMGRGFNGRVITYGLSSTAMLRAEEVSAAWPAALRFTLTCDGKDLAVQTRMLGAHWITAGLAALGAAYAAGVSLPDAACAVAQLEPVPSRMYPVAVDGVTFIDDSIKAPYWTLSRTFEFLAQARCRRKILVMGTISDYSQSASIVYRHVAEQALAVSDEILFVGPNSRYAIRARSERASEALHSFPSVDAAAGYLRGRLRPGDLVMVKGSSRADSLDRIIRDGGACPPARERWC